MKKIFPYVLHLILVPILVSILCFVLYLFHNSELILLISLPVLTALFYVLFRKKTDLLFVSKLLIRYCCVLLPLFAVLMVLADGQVDGSVASCFTYAVFPYFPVGFVFLLMDIGIYFYFGVFLDLFLIHIFCALLSKHKLPSRTVLVAASVIMAVCLFVSIRSYAHRPSVRYSGHGFQFMNGYSSTDFTDYMVYSKNSKLITPEAEVDLQISENMPVMDGAEACYPIYAAIAKAIYPNIAEIEQEFASLKQKEYYQYNGKIVTFTNSVHGFNRLLYSDEEEFENRVDLFFGARPSKQQLAWAQESGIDLTVTPIGKEAFVFFVEQDNPVNDLTSEQIKAIYHGDITNWKEVGGKNQEIVAFQRPENSGSQAMMEYFMGDLTLKEPKTYETVSSMEGVIRQVAQYANENGALGYSFRYFLEGLNQETGVKMLSVDGVYPSVENIENGTYPLIVGLCLTTRTNDPNPNVQKVIDFILSDAGQEIIQKTGYAALSD